MVLRMGQVTPDRLGGCDGRREKRDPAPTSRPHLPCLGGYQCEVCHRGSQHQLEQRLSASKVASLPNPQLNQACQSVFSYLPLLAILLERRTILQGSGLLQQALLRVKTDRSALGPFGLDAAATRRAIGTDRGIKKECGAKMLLPATVSPIPSPDQRARRLPSWTGASHFFQVDLELVLGDLISTSPRCYLGDQLAASVSVFLPRVTGTVCTVANGRPPPPTRCSPHSPASAPVRAHYQARCPPTPLLP